jgi:hypothetical protein
MKPPCTHISLEKAYEVRHWMSVLHLNEPELYAAVQKVGKELEALKRHRQTVHPQMRVRV